MRTISLLGLLVVSTALAVPAAAAPGRGTPGEAKLQQALDQLVAAGAPGAIALVRDGGRTVRATSGHADLKTKRPMTVGDRFRIGSVTKSMVATLVLQLVGEGKLALGDTVERWLPGLVPNGRNLTVRRLLNMTSGLFDYLKDGDETVANRLLSGDWTYRWKPRELVRISNAHKPKFAPGARWSYCNTCYVLLGLIVEETTGSSLAVELRDRVFKPAGLRATSLDGGPRIAGRHVHGYELLGKPPLVDTSDISPSYGWAAGAIVSTADDVARFYRSLLRGRLLRPNLLRAMETTVSMGSGAPGSGYGLGLLKARLPCGVAWGHDGGIPGYRTWALNSREGERQIVVLVNLGEDSFSNRANQALERVLGTAYCG